MIRAVRFALPAGDAQTAGGSGRRDKTTAQAATYPIASAVGVVPAVRRCDMLRWGIVNAAIRPILKCESGLRSVGRSPIGRQDLGGGSGDKRSKTPLNHSEQRGRSPS